MNYIKGIALSMMGLVIGIGSLSAQQSVQLFYYNLLQYGNTSDCENVSTKTDYLKTIFGHFEPDIIGVNELKNHSSYSQKILDEALNTGETTHYQRANYTNQAESGLVNMLYYDARKFGLAGQSVSNTFIRDINHYRLYYKTHDLAETQDTTFLNVVVAHLKAGGDSQDKQNREWMTENAMDAISNNASGNYVFMGDLNIGSSSVNAYQNLVNPEQGAFKFNDPADKPGKWHKNQSFSAYHTQSTRTDFENDCGVTGGMDDRFDFILLSDAMMQGSKNFTYNSGSYKAVAQDGTRYNKSLQTPFNNTNPPKVISALYNMSDHLPVSLKLTTPLEYQDTSTAISEEAGQGAYQVTQNPVGDQLKIQTKASDQWELTITTLTGRQVLQKAFAGTATQSINLNNLKPGIYILKINGETGQQYVHKILKR